MTLTPIGLNPIPFTYLPGYSATQPLGLDWHVTLDPFTGELKMSPNPTGSPNITTFCIEVEEWRKGVKIGSIVRDMLVSASSNCISPNPAAPTLPNPTLNSLPVGTLGPNLLMACVGAPICFDVPVVSQDTALTYQLMWNKGRSTMTGATFFDPGNPAVQDTIRVKTPLGRFCWTPTATGAYFLDVIVTDDACPLSGSANATFLIHVTQPLSSSTISAVPIMNCNAVQLSAIPRSSIPSNFSSYSYSWSGNGNLQPQFNSNLNDSSFIHAYPRPSTYFVDLVLEDTFGCEHSSRDLFTLSSGAVANAGPDLTICSGFQFQLGTPHIPGQAYTWTPKLGINDSTIAQPTFSLVNLNPGLVDTIDYVLHVADSVGCETFDYVKVVINPSLQVRISPTQPQICKGDSLTLRASGGTRYLWSTGDTTATIRYPFSQTTTLSVVVFDNGCTSQPEFVTVRSSPGPTGGLSGSFNVCEGESAILLASGGTHYTWSTTSSMTNLITLSNLTRDTTVWMIPQDANGCLGDTVFARIDTYEKPVPDFSPTAVCQGVQTAFFDQTMIQGGNIASWQWDFGDGSRSSLQYPTHTYLAAGNYMVSLHVISDNACEAQLTRNVAVENLPNAQFDFTNVCQGLPSVFTNRSTINAPSSIPTTIWEFGDGQTGAGNIVAHVYDSSGYYNATLIVISDQGCENRTSHSITVHEHPPFPDLTEDTVCFSDPAYLIAAADADVKVNWYQDLEVVSPFYTGPSYVTAPLSADLTYYVTTTSAFGCESERFPITAYLATNNDLIISPSRMLVELPLGSVAFMPISNAPLTAWNWDFGDGNTSDLEAPVHEFQNPGRYEVLLTAMDQNGCEITAKEIIEVKKIVNAFMPSAFSPNGDGYNDDYKIGNYNLANFRIAIFNRSGVSVFEANEPTFRWNGKDANGKDVPEGVYIYVVRYQGVNGKIAEQTGSITLIR